ncbi:probable inactive histone-lysine N-methyltransferase SUVR2 isoform X2 [Triticum urartu]|nr:probable inactive histone-lysine N-methyltransferase SUVR2 isoform X2 [Triticum urartu]
MISHKDRAQKAYEAMGRLGFPKKQVSPVLKHLYKLFENWEPIEDESYRILADTILDSQKNQQMPATSRHVTDQESEPHNSTSVTPDPDDQHPSAARYDMDVSDNETSLINRPMDVSENPQDALFLQEPKPEPEIDVPAAPVANDLNTGSSESRAVHSEAQNNGGSLQEQALETHAPFVKPIACKHAVDGNGNTAVGSSSEPSFQNWVVAYQPQEALFKQRPLHDVADITKGEERVRIPIVNEFGSDSCPPLFYYIRKNLIFQSAYVNTSLARIGDEDCCADCSGNCLLESHPCACARSTGGEIAYTPEGLVRAELIDECIAVNHFPEKDNKFYCKACPLEIYKTKPSPDPCKGHLARKFIKECWSKCGCGMQCGNRVIQRGITCNLQVFFTNEGKGWGLRTLDGLPKGAFICELVGEVLTSSELHERKAKNSKHVDQVLLDASWGSEGVLRDEEALCVDPTFYGNVGRFVNHRCYDANLVIIPVEVETPDRHYYHLALFTAKKIEAFEELTRDYGIDFDGTDDLNKAFDCMCGSKYCRGGPKNSRKRTRASASQN